MKKRGIRVLKTEPLKLTIDCINLKKNGIETAKELREYKVECEYSDERYVVMMFTPQNDHKSYERIDRWSMKVITERNERSYVTVEHKSPKRVLSIREALFSESEVVPIKESEGRICGALTIACPPALPIAVCGEVIDSDMIKDFEKYGISEVVVLVNSERF